MKNQKVTEALSEFCTNVRYQDLPSEVVEYTKYMFMDNVGCALGAMVTPRSKIMCEMVDEFGGRQISSVIGHGKTSAPLAAFANAELINALDYNYIGPIASHVGPFVTPVCLAVAEMTSASGKELIAALAMGHEVAGRLMSSMAQHKIVTKEAPFYKPSERFSPSTAVFGAVAGAANLMGLDCIHLQNAMGLAGASTPVPATVKWHHWDGPAFMAKYNAWAGWTAKLAVVSAISAQKGFSGDPTILDGPHGYWNIVGSPFFEIKRVFDGLGDVWHTSEVKYKFFPSCHIFHSAMEAVRMMVDKHDIKAEQIAKINVWGDPLLKTPNRIRREILSCEDTQFSVYYNIACSVILPDPPSPAWQLPETYNDSRIQSLMSKIEVHIHPDYERFAAKTLEAGKLPVFLGARVEMITTEEVFKAEIMQPKGVPESQFDKHDLIDKFRQNASYSHLREETTKNLLEQLLSLERVDSVKNLTEFISEKEEV